MAKDKDDQTNKSLAEYAAEENYSEFESGFKEKILKYINENPEYIQLKAEGDRLQNLINMLDEI